MRIELTDINRALAEDPVGYIAECDAVYHGRIAHAADLVVERLHQSRVILLAGPSSSGKTTTASNVKKALAERGVYCHMISLDDYYLPKDNPAFPKTKEGEPDLEAPQALDTELLGEQLRKLDTGEEIVVPFFDFQTQKQDPARFRPLQLKEHEAVIFEGIHGLNPILTERNPEATRIFISTASSVYDNDVEVFDRVWMRVLRRIVRDYYFRASTAEETLNLWKNVRRGEKKFISPYKKFAHLTIDTSHGYEVAVFRSIAEPMLLKLTEHAQPRLIELILEGLESFLPLDPKLLPETSLIREEFLPK